MAFLNRLSRAMDRFYDRIRHRSAFQVSEADALDGDLEPLRGSKYALLVTFRRSGEPVPSPVWVALDEAGRGYVHTHLHAGKVRRIAHDSRALLAESSLRGKPRGPTLAAQARVLPETEWARAEAALVDAYGPGRKFFQTAFARDDALWTYLELTPRRLSP